MTLPATARRGFVAAALVAITGLTLVACSSGAPASSSLTPSAGSTVIATLYGNVTAPANPQRIAALDFPEATTLADLGITPVAQGSYEPDLPAYNTFFKDIPVVTDEQGIPDIEKVAAAKPDLIITDAPSDQVSAVRPIYEKLSAIAPTIILPFTQAAGNWEDLAAITAQAVGKTAALDKLKATYTAHAADIKKEYATLLSTHSIDLVSGNATLWDLYGPTSSHARVLELAGAHLGAGKDQKDGYVDYSPEKYGLLNGTDIILVDASNAQEAAPIITSPVFASLPATQKGNVFLTSLFFPASYQLADALLTAFEADLKNVK